MMPLFYADEICPIKYKDYMVISLPSVILKHNNCVVQTLVMDWKKMSCNSWTVHNFDMIQCTCSSEDVTVHQHVPFLLQWLQRHSVGEYEHGLFDSGGQKATVRKHLSPLWVRTCERNITVVNGGPMWSPSRPAYTNKQPVVPFSRVDFAWTYLLIVMPAPSGERVSKHVPLPCGPAVNQRLKDAWQ